MTFGQRKVVALIPARGGSKGVRRKNLRVVGSRPLLEYTVTAARGSAVIDAIFVSSDDEEILDLATALGVGAIRRPAAAASDTASATDVVRSFLDQLPEEQAAADPFIVYLQPTSPLRTADHIDAAFAQLAQGGVSVVVSVVPLNRSPYKSLKLGEDGLLHPLIDEQHSSANRQQLPATFYPNGAIYIFPVSEFVRRGCFPVGGSLPFVMCERDSLDMDTEEDFAALEKL